MTESNSNKNNISQKIWKLLCSMRFGIALLIILTAISIYGATFLKHQEAMEKVYTSWWFIGILFIAALNLLACSINRFPNLLKKATVLKTDVDIKWLRTLENNEAINLTIQENTKEVLLKILKKNKYRAKLVENNGTLLIAADKGRFGYFGSFITHISLVLILAAGFYSAVASYDNYKAGLPGTIIEVPEYGFDVRIDDFKIAYRDDEYKSIEQYYSTLTVIEDGEEVKTETIYVNKPLRYKGVNFYQATYGWSVDVELKNTETEEVVEMFLVPGQVGFYPYLGIHIRLIDFYPDFTMTSDGVPYSRTSYPANPRVAFQFFDESGHLIGNHYYIEPINETLELFNEHIIKFKDFQNYTGLQIIKQPGKSLALIASILLLIGLFMSFYLYPRKLWLWVDDKNNNTLFIAGNSHRNKVGYKLEFAKILKEIKNIGGN